MAASALEQRTLLDLEACGGLLPKIRWLWTRVDRERTKVTLAPLARARVSSEGERAGCRAGARASVSPGSSLCTPARLRERTGLRDRGAPSTPPKPTLAVGAAPSLLLSSPPCAPGLVVLNISQLRYRTVELLRTTGPGAPAHRSSTRPGAPGPRLGALLRPGPRGPAALRAAAAGVPAPFMRRGRPARRRNAPAALAGPVFPGPRVARRVGPRPQELLRVPARGWP